MVKKHFANNKITAKKIAKQLVKTGYSIFIAEIPKRLRKKYKNHKYVITRQKR